MTANDIIDDVIAREGGPTNDARDAGGRTQFGISEQANPGAWLDGKVTEEEAREIYARKYVHGPGFDRVPDAKLQAQLVDFGVTSGPQVAIFYLQGVLGVPQDYILGSQTLNAIAPGTNTLLVAARVKMIAKIVAKNPSQVAFLVGWITRALEFL